MYDRLSSWYDWFASSEDFAVHKVLDMLAVQPSERLIEIGCGTGKTLAWLGSTMGSGGRLLGVDISAGMLAQALKRREFGDFALCRGDALMLPCAGCTFDVVLMTFTLELFPYEVSLALLAECKRVLRPTGRIGLVALRATQRPGRMQRLYLWAHEHYRDWIDCRPIHAGEIIEGAGFRVTQRRIDMMWGLPVEILVGNLC